jgi:hypothetical protein
MTSPNSDAIGSALGPPTTDTNHLGELIVAPATLTTMQLDLTTQFANCSHLHDVIVRARSVNVNARAHSSLVHAR